MTRKETYITQDKVGQEQNIGAFERREPSGDNVVVDTRRKHGLSREVSLEDIEPVATKLLRDPRTALDAAQLVLNRRVDGRETMIAELIFTPGFSAEERFGLLLMERSTEDQMRKKGITDFGTAKRLGEK